LLYAVLKKENSKNFAKEKINYLFLRFTNFKELQKAKKANPSCLPENDNSWILCNSTSSQSLEIATTKEELDDIWKEIRHLNAKLLKTHIDLVNKGKWKEGKGFFKHKKAAEIVHSAIPFFFAPKPVPLENLNKHLKVKK